MNDERSLQDLQKKKTPDKKRKVCLFLQKKSHKFYKGNKNNVQSKRTTHLKGVKGLLKGYQMSSPLLD